VEKKLTKTKKVSSDEKVELRITPEINGLGAKNLKIASKWCGFEQGESALNF